MKISDLTGSELIVYICKWIRESNILYSTPEIIAQQLEDGTWLEYFNKILEEEKRGNYQDGV